MRLAYAASFLADERTLPTTTRRTMPDGTTSLVTDERPDSLTMNERAVLVYMCSVAHDSDPTPRYWGGRDALARHALGRIVPAEIPGDSPEALAARKARRSIYESVRAALDGLARRGLIERVGSAFPGRAQEYALLVNNFTGQQAELGSSTRTAWANSKLSLLKTQAHIGPETKNTHTPTEHQELPPRAPHVRRPVRTAKRGPQ